MINGFIYIDIHTIAVIRGSENYETVSEGFRDCFKSINDFANDPMIIVDGVQYELKLFFCCDYKVSSRVYSNIHVKVLIAL